MDRLCSLLIAESADDASISMTSCCASDASISMTCAAGELEIVENSRQLVVGTDAQILTGHVGELVCVLQHTHNHTSYIATHYT